MAATIHIHHRHLLLLLSPKADTHFTVPRRVEGWIDLSTAGRVRSLCPWYICTWHGIPSFLIKFCMRCLYFGYLTEGQRHMLQRVLHRASSRGFTKFYYDLNTLAENAHYHLFHHSCCQAHCLNHLYTVKPRPHGAMGFRTRGHKFDLSAIIHEFNKRNLIVRSLFCVFSCLISFCILLYTCKCHMY